MSARVLVLDAVIEHLQKLHREIEDPDVADYIRELIDRAWTERDGERGAIGLASVPR